MGRSWAALAVGLLLATGCGGDRERSSPTISEPQPTATTTTERSSTTSTPSVTTTTKAPPDSPPGYLRYGGAVPAGLQRVVGGEVETLVTEGVVWAADDRAGGVVFTYEPTGQVQNIWRLPAGSANPILAVANVDPVGEPIVVEGATLVPVARPVYPRDQPPPPGPVECDVDNYQHGYADIDTGEMLVLDDCVGLEQAPPLPASAVDTLAVDVRGPSVWPEVTDLPVVSLGFAKPITGESVDVPGNPYPDPCYACRIQPRLSPDGRSLLVHEQVPEPADLGLDSWGDIDALAFEERWTAWSSWADWESPEPVPRTTLRVVDLETGSTLAERSIAGVPGANQIFAFDGRFVAYLSWDGPTAIVDMYGDRDPIIEDGWQIALLHVDSST